MSKFIWAHLDKKAYLVNTRYVKYACIVALEDDEASKSCAGDKYKIIIVLTDKQVFTKGIFSERDDADDELSDLWDYLNEKQ